MTPIWMIELLFKRKEDSYAPNITARSCRKPQLHPIVARIAYMVSSACSFSSILKKRETRILQNDRNAKKAEPSRARPSSQKHVLYVLFQSKFLLDSSTMLFFTSLIRNKNSYTQVGWTLNRGTSSSSSTFFLAGSSTGSSTETRQISAPSADSFSARSTYPRSM